jgi:hypothetical protein
VDTKDLQTEREETSVLKEADAGAGFSPITTSEFEDKTVEIVSETSESQSAVLSVVPKVLETSEENQATGTTMESETSPGNSIASISKLDYEAPRQLATTRHGIKTLSYDRKQLGNALYFTLATIAIYLCLQVWNAPHVIPILIAFGFLACLGFVLASRPNTTYFSSSVYISPFTRKFLRIGAIALPIPFLILGAMDFAARSEISAGDRDYWASKFDSSLQHYTNATILAPRNVEAYLGQSLEYYMLDKEAQSIESADKAIALDATKSYAWSDKARAQFVLDPTSEDAISNAEKAITLDNTNGQAYGTLSELYLNTGNLDKALAAANSHVRIHYDEAHALEVRANILEKLGRTDDAAADRLAMKQKSK